MHCRVQPASQPSQPLTRRDQQIRPAFIAQRPKRGLLDEEATIVTFNYDTLLEQAILKELSGRRWDPVLAYSAPFDQFKLSEGEPFEEFCSFRFPAQAYRAPFLKLHGSLNWFRAEGGGLSSGAL